MHCWGVNAEWPGPGSWHEGGCHILLVDGSTQFLSENVDYRVWSGLNTVNGKEVFNF
jgi:hypothetical protein